MKSNYIVMRWEPPNNGTPGWPVVVGGDVTSWSFETEERAIKFCNQQAINNPGQVYAVIKFIGTSQSVVTPFIRA